MKNISKPFKNEFTHLFYKAIEINQTEYKLLAANGYHTLATLGSNNKELKHLISFNDITNILVKLFDIFAEECTADDFPEITPEDHSATYLSECGFELSLLCELMNIQYKLPPQLDEYQHDKNWVYHQLSTKFPKYITAPTPNKLYVCWKVFDRFIKCTADYLAKSMLFQGKLVVNKQTCVCMFAHFGISEANLQFRSKF